MSRYLLSRGVQKETRGVKDRPGHKDHKALRGQRDRQDLRAARELERKGCKGRRATWGPLERQDLRAIPEPLGQLDRQDLRAILGPRGQRDRLGFSELSATIRKQHALPTKS